MGYLRGAFLGPWALVRGSFLERLQSRHFDLSLHRYRFVVWCFLFGEQSATHDAQPAAISFTHMQSASKESAVRCAQCPSTDKEKLEDRSLHVNWRLPGARASDETRYKQAPVHRMLAFTFKYSAARLAS